LGGKVYYKAGTKKLDSSKPHYCDTVDGSEIPNKPLGRIKPSK